MAACASCLVVLPPHPPLTTSSNRGQPSAHAFRQHHNATQYSNLWFMCNACQNTIWYHTSKAPWVVEPSRSPPGHESPPNWASLSQAHAVPTPALHISNISTLLCTEAAQQPHTRPQVFTYRHGKFFAPSTRCLPSNTFTSTLPPKHPVINNGLHMTLNCAGVTHKSRLHRKQSPFKLHCMDRPHRQAARHGSCHARYFHCQPTAASSLRYSASSYWEQYQRR